MSQDDELYYAGKIKAHPEQMSPGTSFCELIEYYDFNISTYVDVPICFIGTILNAFNILVFTRKNMISPANLIFTHLAIADLLQLLITIPYLWAYFLQTEGYGYYQTDVEKLTYTLTVIYLGGYHLINTLRFMCVFFTVMLAVWRYIAIAYPLKARYWCTMKITRNTAISCYITSILLSIPMYFTYEIKQFARINDKAVFYLPLQNHGSAMYYPAYVTKAVVQQLLPSVVLPIVSFRMVAVLLTKGSNNEVILRTTCSNIQNNARQTDRSIIIILTVVLLFWITQTPSGLRILFIMLFPDIYNLLDNDLSICYQNFVVVLSAGTIHYINMSVSFVVYYAMSKNFRTTFLSLFNSGRIISQKMNVLRLIFKRETQTSPEEEGQVQ